MGSFIIILAIITGVAALATDGYRVWLAEQKKLAGVIDLPSDRDLAAEVISDSYFGVTNNYQDEMPPALSFENDGIGPYEFWGQKCFDAGQTYLICEGNQHGPVTLRFALQPDQALGHFVDTITDAEGDSYVVHSEYVETRKGEADYDIELVPATAKRVVNFGTLSLFGKALFGIPVLELSLEWEQFSRMNAIRQAA